MTGVTLKHDVKILGGLFQGSFKQILSRLTWELSQTLAGYIASQGSNIISDVNSYCDGAAVVQYYSKGWGAFTLGSYINADRNSTDQDIMHKKQKSFCGDRKVRPTKLPTKLR